ncbi:PAP2 superfamily protein [Pseudoxanthomonas sp. GM95]|uniref:phosphatase PAP2 family protein n=1 Tax=Pseudoxanthomonas sp. GM95 TaxID=1881043 RepID=UPI0008B59B6F|nr:phosphatase PAP2 family protein [Pseudoxanthomonas sp. GM95]SEM40635.1 PAP2 superfamily protein [Pseudoxanthomonas sp. GM95]
MPHALDTLLTWMGDSRLVLPVMAALGLLWWRRHPRVAYEWAAVLGLLAATVVASKIAYKAFGVDWRTIGFFTVSGHSALAAALYPLLCYALVAGAGASPRVRHAAVVLGGALALAIAVSRVLTYRHTPVEIVTGLAVGLVVAWLMLRRWHGALAIPVRATPVVIGAAMAAGLAVWLLPNVPAERVLSHIAWRIRS